jgi:hypothetical protein
VEMGNSIAIVEPCAVPPSPHNCDQRGRRTRYQYRQPFRFRDGRTRTGLVRNGPISQDASTRGTR